MLDIHDDGSLWSRAILDAVDDAQRTGVAISRDTVSCIEITIYGETAEDWVTFALGDHEGIEAIAMDALTMPEVER